MFKLFLLTLLVLLAPGLCLNTDCYHTENIDCICTEDSFDCTGFQEEESEINFVFANISSYFSSSDLLYLSLNIRNLSFQEHFTFGNLNKLRNITLGSGLGNLHEGLFRDLGTTLINLNLEHNNLNPLNNQSFSELRILKELNLNYNDLGEVDHLIFYNLSNLKHLSLSGNKISKLSDDLLNNLPLLQTLVISKNNISSVSDISIVSSSLTTLIAEDGTLNGSLGNESLETVPMLEHVDFNSNKLSGVDSYALATLKNLRTLNLSNNRMEYLNSYAFASVYNLRKLDLRKNQLILVTQKAFVNLTHLEYLDLSYNRLEIFLQEYTVDLLSLEQIHLQNNMIKIVTSGTFSNSPHLKEIGMSGNILNCTCELFYFATVLANNSRIWEKNSLLCDSPPSVRGTPVSNINWNCNVELETRTTDMSYDTSSPSPKQAFSTPTTGTYFTTLSEIPPFNTDIVNTNGPSIKVNSTSDISMTNESTSTNVDSIFEATSKMDFETTVKTHKEVTNTEVDDVFSINSTLLEDNTESILTEIKSTEAISTFAVQLSMEKQLTNIETSAATVDEVTSITSPITSSTELKMDKAKEASSVYVTAETVLATQPTLADLARKITTESKTSSTSFTDPIVISMETSNTKSVLDLSSTTSMPLTITDHKKPFSTISPATKSSTSIFISSSTNENNLIIKILNFTTSGKLCIWWTIDGIHPSDLACFVSIQTSEGKRSKRLQCPTEGNEINQCHRVTTVYSFCIYIQVNKKTKVEACELDLMKPISTESLTQAISTSRHDTSTLLSKFTDIVSTENTTPHISTSRPDVSTFLDEITETISIESTTQNISKSIPHTSSTFLAQNTEAFPTIAIPFYLTDMDATLYSGNSVAFVSWSVSLQEPNSICHLKLIWVTTQNYTEGTFKCINGSYTVHNIDARELSKVCISSYHKIFKEDMKCKLFTDPLVGIGFQSSRTKDDGYKNSSLIAVICLFIIVLIIVIVLVIKNLLKKRTEFDRYNVYEHEQNVQRRQSSKRPDPCVRYSYTLKQEEEL